MSVFCESVPFWVGLSVSAGFLQGYPGGCRKKLWAFASSAGRNRRNGGGGKIDRPQIVKGGGATLVNRLQLVSRSNRCQEGARLQLVKGWGGGGVATRVKRTSCSNPWRLGEGSRLQLVKGWGGLCGKDVTAKCRVQGRGARGAGRHGACRRA